jgi:galactonate dehydratase
MNRRQALQSLALAPWLPVLPQVGAPPGGSARHVINTFETFRLPVNHRGDWVLLRTSTAGGLRGLGECSHSGNDERVVALVRQYLQALAGRSIFDIEWLRQWARPEIARIGRVAAVALSAIEQSLWDLQGQALGVPAYQLFGGRLRSRIRQYANINRVTTDRTPGGFARSAADAVKEGFDAVKMAPFDGMPAGPASARAQHVGLGVESARAVRDVLGSSRDLLIDVHSLMTLDEGLALVAELEPLKLYWLEEVTPAEPLSMLASIRRAASMTTAGGEGIYGLEAFYRYAAGDAVDVLMPDVKWCGGMLELRKVAAMAEAMGLGVSPHGPASPVGNVAVSHLCAALPNIEINEFAFGEAPWRADLIDPPEAFDAGHLAVSDRPGFGIRLNDALVRRLVK